MSQSSSDHKTMLLADGVDVSGNYVMDRSDDGHETPLIAYYSHSPQHDAPVVVLLHGYRGDPNGDNNVDLEAAAKGLGFSTLRIAHAGFDHYGHPAAPESKDTGTLVSNIEDLELVLDAIPEKRKIIIIGNSGSFNVGYAAARNDERVSDLIGVFPYPDMYDFINASKSRGQEDLDEKGYHVAKKWGPRCKITQTWLDAGNPVSMSHKVGIMLAPHQPKVTLVRAAKDPTVLPHRLPFMNSFLTAFSEAGICVDDQVIDEKSHSATPAILSAFKRQLIKAARDIGFAANPHQPTSTLRTEHRHPD